MRKTDKDEAQAAISYEIESMLSSAIGAAQVDEKDRYRGPWKRETFDDDVDFD